MLDERSIFITNTMRAGSSYLSRILSAHSEISMSYDSFNFFRFCHQRYDPITEKGNYIRLLDDMSYRLKHRFNITFDKEKSMSLTNTVGFTYASAYWSILRSIFPDENKSILGDQETMAWTKIPTFLDMFPKGKSIVLVRDPRDVVNSFKKITIAPENDYLISIFNCIDAINYGSRFSLKFPNQVYLITFENLKLYPEREIRKLCEFLELEYEEEMLNTDNFTDHFGNKWDDSKSRSAKNENNPLAAVGRWRKEIDMDDLYLCEFLAKKQIQQIGLPLSGENISKNDFNQAINKLLSSHLLQTAFKNWCETGEGSELFPLDPINPKNWDPNGVINKAAFSDK
jgi:hypothetical protein